MIPVPLPRITDKRRLVQALLIATALLLPFLSVAGNPFLRMDIGMRTLFLAGIPVRVDQFYLVLLATLFALAVFLLITVILGRVWCGWLCPQTVFNDLAELVGSRFQKKVSSVVATVIEHITALAIATLISFNLLCWFMAPGQVVSRLLNLNSHPLLFGCFLVMTLLGYINLILVKRSFCRSYCPYGRFQAALTDRGTLNLDFLEETRDICLRCNACQRSCPMGIDIREGYQIECINCGRCIDACRGVMERRPHGHGLIDYRFGVVKGTRFRLGSKASVLLILTLLLGVLLVWGLVDRKQSAFALQRIATVEPRILDGFQLQPWRAVIGNRSEFPAFYSIRVSPVSGGNVTLLGPVNDILIDPNQHRELTFTIRHNPSAIPSKSIELQLYSGDKPVASVTIKP